MESEIPPFDTPREIAIGISDYLWEVPDVEAVMLGGSLSKGFSDEQSDIDLGCFCYSEVPDADEFLEKIREFGAENLCEEGAYRDGETNKWAWLQYGDIEIDIRFHPVESTRNRMERFLNGNVPDPTQGIHSYPFGKEESFLAYTILNCEIVYENDSIVTDLKDDLREYPDVLHEEYVWKRLWSARWMLENKLRKTAKRDDFLYVYPASARFLRLLVTAVFSLNKRYLPDDKWHMNYLESFDTIPENFLEDIREVRRLSFESKEELLERTDVLERMLENTRELAEQELDHTPDW